MRRITPVAEMGVLFAVIIAAGASAESNETDRYDADVASSHVSLEGTSTLHGWEVEGQHIEGYLIVSGNELASLWTTGGPSAQPFAPTVKVEIPVTSLKSGKREMDDKMYEGLKAKTHPTITYHLKSAEIQARQTAQGNGAGGSLTIDTHGVLTVAGVERSMHIPMQVRRLSNDRLEVSGETSLRMTDFGLDPPIAMLGMLRTGDTVRVHWTWVLVRRQS